MQYLRIIWLAVALIVISTAAARAQNDEMYFSIGPTLGVTHYKGDLDDDFTIKFTKPGLGFVVNWHFVNHLFLRFNFFQGWMKASDDRNTDNARIYRNLHFRSPITEVSLKMFYEFIASRRGGSRFRAEWSPFVFAGIGVFTWNPKAKPDPVWVQRYPNLFPGGPDEWIPLRDLGTEGQNITTPLTYYNRTPEGRIDSAAGLQTGSYPTKYGSAMLCIPFGVGVRKSLSHKFDISLEFGMRRPLGKHADYLDDVSGVDMGKNINTGMTGNYADPALLARYDIRSALFSDRSGYTNFGENLTEEWNGFRANDNRGFKENNDWYIYTCVGIFYILGGGERCPKFR
jgi:hypothetical protein